VRRPVKARKTRTEIFCFVAANLDGNCAGQVPPAVFARAEARADPRGSSSGGVVPGAAVPVHGLLGGAGGSWFNCSAGLSGGFVARLGAFAASTEGAPGGWDGWDAGHVACYYGVVRG